MAGIPPAPTTPPSSVLIGRRLAARQGAAQTCGWIDANPTQPAICSAGSTCAVNTAYNVHYCCPSFPCTPPTTCLDATALSTACDDTCSANPLILKCPSYCYTRYWSEATPLIGFGCATSPFIETVYTTNSLGQGKVAPGSTFGLTVAGAPATTAGSTAVNSPSTVTATASTPVSTAFGGSSQSTSLNTTVNPGDIIGISVGSIVGVGIVVFLIVYFLVWRPRQKEKAKQKALHDHIELEPKLGESASGGISASGGPASSAGDRPSQLPGGFTNTMGHGALAPSSTAASTWVPASSTGASDLTSEGRGRMPPELRNPIRPQRG